MQTPIRYLKTVPTATMLMGGISLLAGCANTPPSRLPTISKTRPVYLVPIARIVPPYPKIALTHKAFPNSVTACFKVDRHGHTKDVDITRISIPDTGEKKLNHKIQVTLGAAVLGAVEQSTFFPPKVHGKTVESPRVCEDYKYKLKRP